MIIDEFYVIWLIHVLFLQSAKAFVAGEPACSVLCAEFESDSLIGDKNSVTGVAFGFGKSGKFAGIKATPVAILIGVDVDTFGMVVIFSLIISTGAEMNRLSLSMLFDVVASGVGMRASSFNSQNEEISNGQLILKIKTMDFEGQYRVPWATTDFLNHILH